MEIEFLPNHQLTPSNSVVVVRFPDDYSRNLVSN